MSPGAAYSLRTYREVDCQRPEANGANQADDIIEEGKEESDDSGRDHNGRPAPPGRPISMHILYFYVR